MTLVLFTFYNNQNQDFIFFLSCKVAILFCPNIFLFVQLLLKVIVYFYFILANENAVDSSTSPKSNAGAACHKKQLH